MGGYKMLSRLFRSGLDGDIVTLTKRATSIDREPAFAPKQHKTTGAMTAGTRRRQTTSKLVAKIDAEDVLAETDAMHWQRHGGQPGSDHCCRCK